MGQKNPSKHLNINKFFSNIWNMLTKTQDGIILRNDVIVISNALQQEVIIYAHQGNNGSQLCKRLLRNIYWFPHMDSMIQKTIDDCLPWQANTIIPTSEPLADWANFRFQ